MKRFTLAALAYVIIAITTVALSWALLGIIVSSSQARAWLEGLRVVM